MFVASGRTREATEPLLYPQGQADAMEIIRNEVLAQSASYS